MNATAQPKILLVESSSPMRSLLAEILISRGHAVQEAESGSAARELFELAPEAFDLVVIRSRLPGMTGVDLFKAIRSLNPEKPILFMKESTDDAGDAAEVPLRRRPKHRDPASQ